MKKILILFLSAITIILCGCGRKGALEKPLPPEPIEVKKSFLDKLL